MRLNGSKLAGVAGGLAAVAMIGGCGADPVETSDVSPAVTGSTASQSPADVTSAPASDAPASDDPVPTSSFDNSSPDDVVALSAPSVQFTGTPSGYTAGSEDPLEGYYLDFTGDNGCVLEHRFAMVDAPASARTITNEDASKEAIQAVTGLFGSEALEPELIQVTGVEGGSYPFWMVVMPGGGFDMVVASSYAVVLGEDGVNEAWGVDFTFTCPSGMDPRAEFSHVMEVTRPYIPVEHSVNG